MNSDNNEFPVSDNYLHKRILIIDDEKSITELIRVYFHMEGYTNVRTLNNCSCTTDDVCNEIGESDLLITDLHMPQLLKDSKDIAGFNILLNIKQKQLPTRIFVISGNPGDGSTRATAFKLGADEIFYKPIDFKKLLTDAKFYLTGEPLRIKDTK